MPLEITIPKEHHDAVVDAFCAVHNYSDLVSDPNFEHPEMPWPDDYNAYEAALIPNPVSREQFAANVIHGIIESTVNHHLAAKHADSLPQAPTVSL